MKHLLPKDAWTWLHEKADSGPGPAQNGPLFVDVRMEIEYLYVGRPPGVQHIAWYEYPDLAPDPLRFVSAVLAQAGQRHRPILLICRNGQRTLEAARALETAGFTQVAHVVHGFEGDLNENFHRSSLNGWRYDGLPWEQM